MLVAGGALSKLLIQSIRPEWNKQEEASIQMALEELRDLISATGIHTPDTENMNLGEPTVTIMDHGFQYRRRWNNIYLYKPFHSKTKS